MPALTNSALTEKIQKKNRRKRRRKFALIASIQGINLVLCYFNKDSVTHVRMGDGFGIGRARVTLRFKP
jgi:hypothetical protein